MNESGSLRGRDIVRLAKLNKDNNDRPYCKHVVHSPRQRSRRRAERDGSRRGSQGKQKTEAGEWIEEEEAEGMEIEFIEGTTMREET